MVQANVAWCWFRMPLLTIPIFYNWFRDDSARSTTSEDEGVYSLKPPINGNYGRYSSGPPSITSAPEVLQNATSSNPNYFEEDLTPKHYIRSPIIEETESNVEAELRSRQRSRQQQRWIENIKFYIKYVWIDSKQQKIVTICSHRKYNRYTYLYYLWV